MPGDHRSCRSELKKCSPIHEYLRDLYYLILSGAREAFRAWHSTRLVVFVPGTAEVMLGRLAGLVAEQKLNLVELTAG